jgi:hypothetical protein
VIVRHRKLLVWRGSHVERGLWEKILGGFSEKKNCMISEDHDYVRSSEERDEEFMYCMFMSV